MFSFFTKGVMYGPYGANQAKTGFNTVVSDLNEAEPGPL